MIHNTTTRPENQENETCCNGYQTGFTAGYLQALRDAEVQLEKLADGGAEKVTPILPPPCDQSAISETSTPVSELKFSTRTVGCFRRANIQTVEQLIAWPEKKLLTIRNFGIRSLSEVRERLAERQLALQCDLRPIDC